MIYVKLYLPIISKSKMLKKKKEKFTYENDIKNDLLSQY